MIVRVPCAFARDGGWMEGSWAGSRGNGAGWPMLTSRPRRTHRLQVPLPTPVLAVTLLLGILSPPVGAVPTETDNGNASRTVSWKATDPGLTLQGVSLENGTA